MPLDTIQATAADQFSRQSQRYGKSHILTDVSDVQAALRDVHLAPASKVLDIACGAGHTGLLLAEMGHHVTLADISPAMLERVQEAAAQRKLSVETRCHAAEEFPYPARSFDLVTCRVAAHHFSNVPRFVAEVARVLKPGGAFLLIDGSVEDNQPEAEAWLHQVEKLRDPSHVRFLSPARWETLCGEAGLTVESSKLVPMKQPDLEWYFETAATPPENRDLVRALVANAPDSARTLLRLCKENGKIVWWWQIVTLLARRGEH